MTEVTNIQTPTDDQRQTDDFLMKYIVGRTEWATMNKTGQRVIVDVSDRTSRDYKPVLIGKGWYMVYKKRYTLDSQLVAFIEQPSKPNKKAKFKNKNKNNKKGTPS